jgi:hypothetical protein
MMGHYVLLDSVSIVIIELKDKSRTRLGLADILCISLNRPILPEIHTGRLE